MDVDTGLIDLMVHSKELDEEGLNSLPIRSEAEVNDTNPIRPTLTKCPRSKYILDRCGLPFGFLVEPFRDAVETTPETVASCYDCDAFINPFTKFINKDEWTCNLCGVWNSLKVQNKKAPPRGPVLSSVEFCVTRPEHLMFIDSDNKTSKASLAETYLYVFDTSRVAVQSGYLQFVADIILSQLDALAERPSARMGFITFSKEIHLYRLDARRSNRLEKLILVDLDEMKNVRQMVIPRGADFLLNVSKDKDLIVDFLRQLADEYAETLESYSALGPVLHAVYEIMRLNGGRVTVFQSSRPSIGVGQSVKCSFVDCHDESFREIAQQCRYQAITLDLFLVGGCDMELPTLSVLCRETGGSIFRFPDFSSGDPLQSKRLERTLRRYLTRFIGFAPVMRVYLSPGLSIVRRASSCQADEDSELETSVIHPDVAFGFEVTVDHQLLDHEKEVYFQVAVTYTSKDGELLTRVHTLNLPVGFNEQEVAESADAECIVGLWAKLVAKWMVDDSSCVDKTRQLLSDLCVQFLKAHNTLQVPASETLKAPGNLKLLPYYVFCLLNSVIFKGVNTRHRVDDGAYFLHRLSTSPLRQLMDMISPVLYVVYPKSSRRFYSSTIDVDSTASYLLRTSDVVYFIVGAEVEPRVDSFPTVYQDVDAVPVSHQLRSGELKKMVDLLSRREDDFPPVIQVSRGYSFKPSPCSLGCTAEEYYQFLLSMKKQVFPVSLWNRFLQIRVQS